MQREIDAEKARRAERQRQAVMEAGRALDAAKPAAEAHPYLIAKRVLPERLWQTGADLLVPMTDIDGRVWNVQRIAPDGTKRFLPGGRANGLFWVAGRPQDAIHIAEGVATAKAVRRALGVPVVAAMSAENLPRVATAIHERCPTLAMTICADDDQAGMEAARAAVKATGAALAVPGVTA